MCVIDQTELASRHETTHKQQFTVPQPCPTLMLIIIIHIKLSAVDLAHSSTHSLHACVAVCAGVQTSYHRARLAALKQTTRYPSQISGFLSNSPNNYVVQLCDIHGNLEDMYTFSEWKPDDYQKMIKRRWRCDISTFSDLYRREAIS